MAAVLLQPPTVYKDMLFVGWAGKDWADRDRSPGTVFALDARTGALHWTFHALTPRDRAKSGTGNVWASMSVDPERDLLYMPVSSPTPNFYGGNRLEPCRLATSVTALDTETGSVVWTRQLVHHDIWDLDTNSAPTLVDIEKDGRTIPALVQTSKQGFLYVLNRETGEPIYPIEERPVPASTVPGEVAAPTQPYVALPEARRRRHAGRASSGSPTAASFGYCTPHRGRACATRALHAAEPRGLAGLSGHDRRRRMGRRRGRSDEAASSSSIIRARCRSTS